jgi:hypothetical protein
LGFIGYLVFMLCWAAIDIRHQHAQGSALDEGSHSRNIYFTWYFVPSQWAEWIERGSAANHRPAAVLQLQKSVAMTAGRYVQILEGLEAGKIREAEKDMDWWLDMAILDLQGIEERHPQGHWSEVTVDKDVELKMKSFYRRIAQYRRSHPRQHLLPLEPSQLNLIDEFVQKYQ